MRYKELIGITEDELYDKFPWIKDINMVYAIIKFKDNTLEIIWSKKNSL